RARGDRPRVVPARGAHRGLLRHHVEAGGLRRYRGPGDPAYPAGHRADLRGDPADRGLDPPAVRTVAGAQELRGAIQGLVMTTAHDIASDAAVPEVVRSEEHTSELQSREH